MKDEAKDYRELLKKVTAAKSKEDAVRIVEEGVAQKEIKLKKMREELMRIEFTPYSGHKDEGCR